MPPTPNQDGNIHLEMNTKDGDTVMLNDSFSFEFQLSYLPAL
jgi:hypothetical protein